MNHHLSGSGSGGELLVIVVAVLGVATLFG